MTIEEMKEKIKDWVADSTMSLTIGDLMMFAFDEVVSGKDVTKCVFSLANEGFLRYVDSKLTNPFTGELIPCFKRNSISSEG